RGTSVYFPDMVLPMLPEQLSNGICSLNMGVDRLALSCIMKIDGNGQILEYTFAKSVINVDRRVTYEDANAMLEEGDTKLINDYGEVYQLLKNMAQLAKVLQNKRRRRGSIDFEVPECQIVLGADGRAVDVYPYECGISNAMIEEFMLSANECAARLAQKYDLPFLYRVHEEPDSERMDEFFTLIKALGVPYSKPKGKVTPKMLQTLLNKTAGLTYESVVSRVMLRCMKKARYCERNFGHFGLALEHYCHFTAPIRRYPDIMVHRAITAHLEGKEKEFESNRPLLIAIAEHTSERERNAMEAERDVDDLKKAEYMRDKIGNQYEGVISGDTEFGLFVELPNTVEGLIRITSLDDDYYIYDEKLYRLTGKHTGKVYSIGDKIKITVASVDMKMRKCEFVPAENGKAIKGRTNTRHKR
ncbi:MAG: VacB/RNase II family 3'-5' exoribonuclease, partial [Clostridiales bacterium]|nr:VacB/RNase II family 3'-5' exoribonuclease [Clostridiales bacterium]